MTTYDDVDAAFTASVSTMQARAETAESTASESADASLFYAARRSDTAQVYGSLYIATEALVERSKIDVVALRTRQGLVKVLKSELDPQIASNALQSKATISVRLRRATETT